MIPSTEEGSMKCGKCEKEIPDVPVQQFLGQVICEKCFDECSRKLLQEIFHDLIFLINLGPSKEESVH